MKVTKWAELFGTVRRDKCCLVDNKVEDLRQPYQKDVATSRLLKSFHRGSKAVLVVLNCYALLLPNKATSAPVDLQIYRDALESGWVDYGWANRNYSNTKIVRSGNNSLSVTAAPYEGIHLHHAAFDSSNYTALTFWIHGGAVGGQRLQVGGILSGKGQTSYNLPPLQSSWQQVTILLSTLGVAGKPDLDGFYIGDISGTSSPTYLLDDISLTVVQAPSVVSINVDASQIRRTVDNRLFGLNCGAWESSFTSPDNPVLLKEIDNKILRFPGGSLSDVYHWLTNQTVENGQTATQPLSFDVFAQAALQVGNQGVITVNYGSGTPEEAANWVQYSNKTKGYGLKYWEIGNESYGTWEYDTNSRSHDPYTYAMKAKQYITQMKAVDPTIKVGIVVTTDEDSYSNNYTDHPAKNPRTGQTHHGWTSVMLSTLKNLGVTPDFVSYHKYINGPGQEDDATLLQSTRSWTVDIANIRTMLSDYLGTDGTKVEIMATEHNSVWDTPTGKQMTSLVNGLFLADSIGQTLQTELSGLVWWLMRSTPETNGNNSPSLYGWRQYGGYGMISQQNTGYERYPTFYISKLLSKFTRGGDKVVKVTSNYALVSAYAVKRTNGMMALLIINKSPTDTFNTNISLSGYSPSTTATVYSYGIPQEQAAQNKTGSPDIAQTNISRVKSSFSFQSAPYSASVLLFNPV